MRPPVQPGARSEFRGQRASTPAMISRRAIVFAATAFACLVHLTLGCIGPIAPTACATDAQCAADTTCQRGICVYRQGYGEGGQGGAGGAGGADAGEATDANDADGASH